MFDRVDWRGCAGTRVVRRFDFRGRGEAHGARRSVSCCVRDSSAGLAVTGKTILRAKAAKVAFAKAAALLREASIIATGVHPTA